MKSSYAAAGFLIVALVLWMATGLLRSESPDANSSASTDHNGDTSNAENDPANKRLMQVQVTPAQLQVVTRELTLQGQLNPNRRLTISAGTEGRVQQLPVTKGTRVEAGQLLVALEQEGRTGLLSEARAKVKTALSEQSAAEKLQKRGLQSQLQLQTSQADLATARVYLESIERDIAETAIKAPFPGIVNALPVEVGERIEKGQPVLELIDNSLLRATATVAQQNISLLSVGQKVEATLFGERSLPGVIEFISAVANSSTRSFTIEATIDNSELAVAAGVSTTLIIAVESLDAVFVSPSTIMLGEDGELGVKIVNADDLVEFKPISIVRSNSRGAWISGITDGARVITLGQGFVNAGETVIPQENNDAPSNRGESLAGS